MLERKPVRIDPSVAWFADVRTVLSPMAGVTDRSFRDVCKGFGVGLTFCEFTAAKGLTYDNPQTWRLVDTEGEEGRVGVQIFGAEPDAMAGAARLMDDVRLDVLDINFGCPAKKVVKKCGGSALLADVDLLKEIVDAVVDASAAPVTAKIRTGWDEDSVNYREVGLVLQEAGCRWVTMHGRTRAQKFRGHADWSRIADLVDTLDIPVIGNGDVVDGDSYERMVRETRCHAVMVGRGAMGNPWLFREMDAADGLADYAPPTLGEIMDVVEQHIDAVARLRGERYGSQLVRKHVVRYFRDFPGAAAMRRRLFAVETGDEMLAVLAELKREVELRQRSEGGDLPVPEFDADAEPGLSCGLDQGETT
jgi:tRNA-dihydrouridine synthase B